MKKKLFILGGILLIGGVSYTAKIMRSDVQVSDLVLANIEALAEHEVGSQVEWWDFFNNHVIADWMPISSTNCTNGQLSYKGVTVAVSSCTQYTKVLIHYCYDGGSRDECTSTKVQTYA